MLRRKPTRVELSQADIDGLDVVRAERDEEAASAAAAANNIAVPSQTRREAAITDMSDRQRLGLPSAAAAAAAAAGDNSLPRSRA
jgi:hypothetical protein